MVMPVGTMSSRTRSRPYLYKVVSVPGWARTNHPGPVATLAWRVGVHELGLHRTVTGRLRWCRTETTRGRGERVGRQAETYLRCDYLVLDHSQPGALRADLRDRTTVVHSRYRGSREHAGCPPHRTVVLIGRHIAGSKVSDGRGGGGSPGDGSRRRAEEASGGGAGPDCRGE